MPKGLWNTDLPYCKICQKKLRPLSKKDDYPNRKFHISCWKELLADIKHYNKRAYTKFNHQKIICGVPELEARERLANGEKILITFD
tara:strand:+ start:2037 stop:2297 length:261 start_codon:yes stop_codon:yes gene_type:complete